MEVNGSKVRDMPHEELVKFIRQQSMEDGTMGCQVSNKNDRKLDRFLAKNQFTKIDRCILWLDINGKPSKIGHDF